MGSAAVVLPDSFSWRYINHLLAYLTSLLTFFLTNLLPYLFTSLRMGPFRFCAGYHKRRLNLAVVFCVRFAL